MPGILPLDSAWATLPAALKAGILAMIVAAKMDC
jgi:hypothetical protein